MASNSGGGTLKQWSFEIGVIAFSIFTLIAMAALLAAFNEKPVFDTEMWTLNAFVSTLSTASKGCLLTVIDSCISRGNWI